jgi:hypothetical protein
MEIMLNWLVSNWDKFSIWVTNQPTFVEVAFGVGLFYGALLILKGLFKLLGYLFSGLSTGSRRSRKIRKKAAKSSGTKPVTMDDDAPPFVFR